MKNTIDFSTWITPEALNRRYREDEEEGSDAAALLILLKMALSFGPWRATP